MANSEDAKYRVSLKFSDKDKDQEEVVALLKQMGRRKSAFITKAVKYYLSENPEAEIPGITQTTITKSTLRSMLKELLEEMEDSDSQSISKIKEAIKKEPVTQKEEKKTKPEPKKQTEETFEREIVSDDEVDSFLAGLDAWDMGGF